jgi:hypothetical protein
MSGKTRACRRIINEAIMSHQAWKEHLDTAITTRASALRVKDAECDNKCVFGQWLHSQRFPEELKNSAHFNTIHELHARFHKNAANVLVFAQEPDGCEFELCSEFYDSYIDAYEKASRDLITALECWKESEFGFDPDESDFASII